MANTKVTGDLIASGTITAANLVSGTLDTLLNGYLTTNSYATESYVTTAVSNLIDAAPASLDTLNELAAALNDDANFATTVTDSIATKLPLAGGNITGNLSVDTNVLFVDTANDRVGIGTSSPAAKLTIKQGAAQLDIATDSSFAYLEAIDRSDVNLPVDLRYYARRDGNHIWYNQSYAERMRIDSAGSVGIGTSSPFSVNGKNLHIQDSLVARWGDFIIYDADAASTRFSISSNGNVGIGTGSPATTFHVAGGGNKLLTYDASINRVKLNSEYNASGTTEVDIFFETRNGGNWRTSSIKSVGRELTFNTGGTGGDAVPAERMRITSVGQLIVGATSLPNPTDSNVLEGFGVSSDGYFIATRNSANVANFRRVGTEGDLLIFWQGVKTTDVGSISVTSSSTSYNTTSDYRLKENVIEITGALERVNALKPSRFNFVADPDKTVDGFLAHEVQGIVPEAITGDKDGIDENGNPVYQKIDQSKLVPLLTAAIQELKGIVDNQQIEIDNLKAQLNG